MWNPARTGIIAENQSGGFVFLEGGDQFDALQASAGNWVAPEPDEATPEAIAASLAQARAAMVISPLQGILTLGETEWGKVLTYRETASWAEKVVIDSAQDWQRTSQNIAFFGYLLGYTDAQMDALFIAAAQVTA
jgi:hypothetical protein